MSTKRSSKELTERYKKRSSSSSSTTSSSPNNNMFKKTDSSSSSATAEKHSAVSDVRNRSRLSRSAHQVRNNKEDGVLLNTETIHRILQVSLVLLVLGVVLLTALDKQTLSRFTRALVGGDQVPDSCTVGKKIAMTFDDGPGLATDKYLDVLKNLNVKVTFHFNPTIVSAFSNGPRFVKRAYDEGHVVGLRFDPNLNASQMSDADIKNTLVDGANKIRGYISQYPKFVRFNYGGYDSRAVKIAKSLGLTVTQHNIDSGDYKYATSGGNPGGEVHRAYYLQVDAIPKGSFISLHHDLNAGAADLLNDLIPNLLARSFTLVTLNDCVGEPAAYLDSASSDTFSSGAYSSTSTGSDGTGSSRSAAISDHQAISSYKIGLTLVVTCLVLFF